MLLGEAALRLGGARLVMGRAEVLPFEGDSFDALFCECVLSVLDDRMAALDEFARVVKDGGALVISDVFRKGEHGRGGQTDGLLTREELLDLVSGRGFNLLLWEAHDRLLREFAVRMILAGECLPDSWGGGRNRKEGNTDGPAISYFLLVARKSGGSSGREAVTPL
jgi:SAM-dependent methyltransferase